MNEGKRRYRSHRCAAQQYTSSLINYFIVSIKDAVIVRIIISSRIKSRVARQHKRKNDMPRHRYVCVYYIRFIRLGHSHRRAATPSRGRFGVGAPRTLVHCHPPDGGTHGHGDRESYTVQTNPEAPSLSACRCIAPCRACNCVPSTRSDVDCSVKLPGNRPGDYITHTYWWV